jgi:2,4-dienoyl-CoA reductase-like NADH-dependent reductase (Old Yellow Enzyme family)
MAPMGAFGLVDNEGCYSQRAIDYYVERAKGGTGLIITSITKVWRSSINGSGLDFSKVASQPHNFK